MPPFVAEAPPTKSRLSHAPPPPTTARGIGVRYVHGLAHRDWILHLGEHYRIESQLQEVFLDMHIFDTVNSWKLLQAEGLFAWKFQLTQEGESAGIQVQVQSDGWISLCGCPARQQAAAQSYITQLLCNPSSNQPSRLRTASPTAASPGTTPTTSFVATVPSRYGSPSEKQFSGVGPTPVFPQLDGIHNTQNLPLPTMTSLVTNCKSQDVVVAEEGVDFWEGIREIASVSQNFILLLVNLTSQT
jgi:hypothetical protein